MGIVVAPLNSLTLVSALARVPLIVRRAPVAAAPLSVVGAKFPAEFDSLDGNEKLIKSF